MESSSASESGQKLNRKLSDDAPSPPPRSRGKSKSVSKVTIKQSHDAAIPEVEKPSPPPKPGNNVSEKRHHRVPVIPTPRPFTASKEKKTGRPPPPAKPPVLDKMCFGQSPPKHIRDMQPPHKPDDEHLKHVSPPKPRPRPVPRPKPRPGEFRSQKAKSMGRPTPAPRKDLGKKLRSMSQTSSEDVLESLENQEIKDHLESLVRSRNSSVVSNEASSETERIDENSNEFIPDNSNADPIDNSSLVPTVNGIKDSDGKSDSLSRKVIINTGFIDTPDVHVVERSLSHPHEDTRDDKGPQKEPVSIEYDVNIHDSESVMVSDQLGVPTKTGPTYEQMNLHAHPQIGLQEATDDKEIIITTDDENIYNEIPNTGEIRDNVSSQNENTSLLSVEKRKSHSYENAPLFSQKEHKPESPNGSLLSANESVRGVSYENVVASFVKGEEAAAEESSHANRHSLYEEPSSIPADFSNEQIMHQENVAVEHLDDGHYVDPGEYVRLEYKEGCYVDMASGQPSDNRVENLEDDEGLENMQEMGGLANYQIPSSPPRSTSVHDEMMFGSQDVNDQVSDISQKPRRPAPPPPSLALRDPLKARPWHQKPYSPSKGTDYGDPLSDIDRRPASRSLTSQFSEPQKEFDSETSSGTSSRTDETEGIYSSPSCSTTSINEPRQETADIGKSSRVSLESGTGIAFPPNYDKRYSYSSTSDTSLYNHPRSSVYSEPGNRTSIQSWELSEGDDSVYIAMSDNALNQEEAKDVGETPEGRRQELLNKSGKGSRIEGIATDDEKDHVYLQPVDGNIAKVPPARPPPPQFASYDAEENFYEKIHSLKQGMAVLVNRDEDDSTDTESDDDVHSLKIHEGDSGNKLYHIASEILTTERTFVAALKLLVEDFGGYLKKIIAKDPRALPEGAFSQMFMNIEQIYSLDKRFLQELEARMRNWEEHRRIGDIIREYGHFLKMYTSYIKGYDKAMTIFQDYLTKYPKFSVLVREFERNPKCKNLKITSYMLKPIQRIPSYRLLLVDYLKHLPRDSSDYQDISGGLSIVSEVGEYINDSMKEGEKFQEVLRVQSQIINSNEIVKPGRFLLKEGMLHKLSRKESQERMFFLFTDTFLYCSVFGHGQYRLIQELPLAGMTVHVPESVDFLNEFTVVSTKRSFTLAASTPEERLMWIEALNGAISDVAKKMVTFNVKMEHEELHASLSNPIQEIGAVAPPWIPDDRVTMCQVCTTTFTVYNRRHHCRACGQVVCSHCSSYEAPLQYMDYEAARVCENCFKELLTILEEETRLGLTTDSSTALTQNEILAKFKDVRKKKKSKHGKKVLPSKFTEVSAQDIGSNNSGYLKVKKGKTWKKYWFVLKDHVLYSYKASSDPAALDTLPVLGYEIKKVSWDVDYIFQLMHQGLKEPLTYKCESKVSAERWYKCMTQATALDIPK